MSDGRGASGRVRAAAGLAGTTALVAACLAAAGCGADTTWPKDFAGPKVVVSFAPLYCFAANVGGEHAAVRSVMTTTGPHDFNPSETEARLLYRADVFFVNGFGLDDRLADRLRTGSGNRKLKLVDLGARIPADRLLAGEEHAGHSHGAGHDPHVWLSPEFAVLMTEGVRDELKAADPAHAADYDRRAAEYTARLRKLKADGLDLLKDKKDRRLVTFHESLAYFARDFDLTVAGVVQKKPGTEPNQDELTGLVRECREHNVRLIAIEPQYTAKTSAETVVAELKRKGLADAAAVEIDPLETADPAALTPGWYETKMRANLDALAKAMK